jgi:hypothetical protein
MLPLEEVTEFIESMLAGGENHTDAILEAAFERFGDDIDATAARRAFVKKRVSLAVSQMKDGDGERVAFSSRDPDGSAIIVHLDYTDDRMTLLHAAHRYDGISKAAAKIRDRLMERAGQLTLNLAA